MRLLCSCITLAVVLAACAGSSPVFGQEQLRQAPARAAPGHAEDVRAIQQNEAAYLKAFNAGDAPALAAFWTEDGEFVDAQGRSFRGRAAIEKEFTAFFAEVKGARLDIKPDALRCVSPGVFVESGSARVTRPGGAASSASYTIVHARHDGRWQLASVRETAPAPASNEDELHELEWLVGSWSARSGTRSVELSCEWAAQRNFLTRRYTFKDGDGAIKSGMQVIGWDPRAGRIRSWTFDSDGGFGSEWWSRDGERWLLEASSLTRDGAAMSSLNVLTRLDHDSFTWQSLQRVVDQARLPDTALIKMSRIRK